MFWGCCFSARLQNHNFSSLNGQNMNHYRPNVFWLFLCVVSAAFDGQADSRIPKTRRHVMCFFGLLHVGQALEPKQHISKKQTRTKHHYRPHLRWPLICSFSAVFDGGADAGMLKTNRPAIRFRAPRLSQEPDPKQQMSETTSKQKYD